MDKYGLGVGVDFAGGMKRSEDEGMLVDNIDISEEGDEEEEEIELEHPLTNSIVS